MEVTNRSYKEDFGKRCNNCMCPNCEHHGKCHDYDIRTVFKGRSHNGTPGVNCTNCHRYEVLPKMCYGYTDWINKIKKRSMIIKRKDNS